MPMKLMLKAQAATVGFVKRQLTVSVVQESIELMAYNPQRPSSAD